VFPGSWYGVAEPDPDRGDVDGSGEETELSSGNQECPVTPSTFRFEIEAYDNDPDELGSPWSAAFSSLIGHSVS
jgi:hypothetical protein